MAGGIATRQDLMHTIESEKYFKRESADGFWVSWAGVLYVLCSHYYTVIDS